MLITGGGGCGNEALWRLLHRRYTVHFCDADLLSINPTIPEDRHHGIPWATDPEFSLRMVDLCKRLKIDVLIPTVDEELAVLARVASELHPTRLLVPDITYIETMLDKFQMIATLSGERIPVPRSAILSDTFKHLNFPCIVKPRRGRGSRDVKTLNSFSEADDLRQMLGAKAVNTLLQEKVEGTEYTIQMIADAECRLHAIVPVEVEVKRGITLRAKTVFDRRILESCRAIHNAVPTRGCYNIQLIMDRDGRVLPFEINPRVSTTLCLTIAAGVDPIEIYYSNIAPASLLPYTTNVSLRRHWKNFLRYD